MNANHAIETLKVEAKNNPTTDAVLHVWALRRRARQTVTLGALKQRMKAEGFNYDSAKYAEVLSLMAKLGFGRLVTDPKGRVRALTDVKVTLQSIGAAVCGSGQRLSDYKRRNRFRNLPATPVASEPPKALPTIRPLTAPQVSLSINLNGKLVNIQVPSNMSAEEVAALVCRFQTA